MYFRGETWLLWAVKMFGSATSRTKVQAEAFNSLLKWSLPLNRRYRNYQDSLHLMYQVVFPASEDSLIKCLEDEGCLRGDLISTIACLARWLHKYRSFRFHNPRCTQGALPDLEERQRELKNCFLYSEPFPWVVDKYEKRYIKGSYKCDKFSHLCSFTGPRQRK